LPVRKVRSHVRFFDERRLQLLRWVSERYLAPLSVIIERSYPPRVAGEERSPKGMPREAGAGHAERGRPQPAPTSGVLARYGEPERLLDPGSVTWLRPLPDDEALVCVEAVGACAAAGRQGLVLVPEAEPLPA